MVSLLNINPITRFANFFVSNSNELNKLPTYLKAGQDELSTIKSYAYGSLARCENGDIYILSGNNEWILYNVSSSGGGGGGASLNVGEIANADIMSLFS